MMNRLLAALLLAALPAWGAHLFDDAASDFASSGTAEVTDEPMTFACWVRSDDAASSQVFLSLDNTGSTSGTWIFRLQGNVAGDPVRAIKQQDDGTVEAIDTTSAFSADTWHHTAAVFSSDDARRVYIDGGSEGSESGASASDPSVEHTSIGVRTRQVGDRIEHMSGEIAECGIWSADIRDEGVATLADGYAPPCVRRDALVAYYPMIRDSTSLKDHFDGANNLSLTGTTVADHPRVNRCE